MRSHKNHWRALGLAIIVVVTHCPDVTGAPRDDTAALVRSGVLSPLSSAPQSRVSEFWNDTAEPVLAQRIADKKNVSITDWPAQFGAGSHISVGPNGTWYLFTRRVYWNESEVVPRLWSGTQFRSLCGMHHVIGTDVRKSTDAGRSWSAPKPVVIPREGTEFECMGGDGDAYFDPDTNTWHYLTQCLSRHGGWKGCYLRYGGVDPTSSSAEWRPGSNGLAGTRATAVVINNGDLWKKICVGNALCARTARDFPQAGLAAPFDEGTFNIIHKDPAGFFWISFHGFDLITGYRGIAKTRDFATFIAGDANQGTPTDSIFDVYRERANPWREAWQGWAKLASLSSTVPGTHGLSIGGGGGQVYYEKATGSYFLLVESADRNLACVPGQNWNVGLYRSSSLASSFWSPIPSGNPIFYSDHTPGPPGGFFPGQSFPCGTAYKRFFTDGHTFYHHFKDGEGSTDAGLMLYQLAPKRNALKNNRVQRCDTAHWLAWDRMSDVKALRYSKDASDLGCSLAVRCRDGSACTSGESVYQDFLPSALGHRDLPKGFGGEFKSRGPGRLLVALFQLDPSGRTIAVDTIEVHTTEAFQLRGAPFTLRPTTASLRYQIYPLTAGVEFIADSMFAGEKLYLPDTALEQVQR